MRRVWNHTFSRFPHISAQPVVFRTFRTIWSFSAQFCTISDTLVEFRQKLCSVKTIGSRLDKNCVDFRQFGLVSTKTWFSRDNWVSLDKNCVQFRQLG